MNVIGAQNAGLYSSNLGLDGNPSSAANAQGPQGQPQGSQVTAAQPSQQTQQIVQEAAVSQQTPAASTQVVQEAASVSDGLGLIVDTSA